MKRRVLLLVLVSCLFVLSGIASASLPWAEYGGDAQNTGQSSYVGPQTTEYNWKTPLGGDNSDSFVSPVVDGSGTIYLFDDAGRGWWEYVNDEYVYHQPDKPFPSVKAINKSGILKWSKDVDSACTGGDGSSALALGTNGLLYLACSDYYSTTLFAIQTTSGNSAWELPLDPSYSYSKAVGNLTVDSNNTLYIGATYRLPDTWETDHSIVAISKDGAVLWTTNIGRGRGWDFTGPVLSPDKMTVYIYRYGYTQTSEGSNVYSGFISALATDTGAVKWDLPLEDGGTGWQTFTSFAVDANGTIWLASYRKPDPNICYGRAEFLMSISPDGDINHLFPLEGDMDCGSHVRVGKSGTIYITYDDTRSNWYWDGTQWLQVSTWRNWDGSKYEIQRAYWDGTQWIDIPSPKGGIAAYDPVNGFKWRFELPDSCEANASPAIDANENIYFAASYGERLYSLNKDGQVNWEFNIAPGVEPSHCYNRQSSQAGNDQLVYGVAPVIGLDGSVYFMGEKNLYGLDTRMSEGTVISTIDNLVSDGTLGSNDAAPLTNMVEKISSVPNTQTKQNLQNAATNKIDALENSGRIDSSTANGLRSAVKSLN